MPDLAGENYQIVEVRDFNYPGLTDFTFQYPVFKNWEVLRIENTGHNEWEIFLDYPESVKFETAPRITVNMKKPLDMHSMDFEIPVAAIKNGNGVPYIYTEDAELGNYASFYADEFNAYITLGSHSDEDGFSKEFFWKTVIDSFKIINKSL